MIDGSGDGMLSEEGCRDCYDSGCIDGGRRRKDLQSYHVRFQGRVEGISRKAVSKMVGSKTTIEWKQS